jgi:hypothetical protein
VEGSLKKMNIEHLSKQPCTPKVQPANADKQVSAYGGIFAQYPRSTEKGGFMYRYSIWF